MSYVKEKAWKRTRCDVKSCHASFLLAYIEITRATAATVKVEKNF